MKRGVCIKRDLDERSMHAPYRKARGTARALRTIYGWRDSEAQRQYA